MPRIADSEREGKRTAIVRAAAAVLARQGYTSTRMADIAVGAGVGKGTLYEYFPSKEELFFAVFETIHADALERLTRTLDTTAGALDTLRALLQTGADVVSAQRELHGVTLDFWAASSGGPHQNRFEQFCNRLYVDYREMTAAVLRRGQATGEIDPGFEVDAVATMIVAAYDGLGVQHCFDPDLDPHRITAHFVQALIDGLARRDDRTRNPRATGA